jgi:hypothetical protein
MTDTNVIIFPTRDRNIDVITHRREPCRQTKRRIAFPQH